jgi:hypothetical protein|tara:strand:+ start:267 stop:389 length:123 start_codon:yes stop_codon:yes gene_type:complete
MIKRGQANWRPIIIAILMLTLAIVLFLAMKRVLTVLINSP